jgi:ketosteroid isomerase-like protein
MTAEDIRSLVYQSYEAFDRGDRSFVVDLFDDDIEWIMNAAPESLPFPNRVKGKTQVLAALKAIDDVVETLRNELLLVMVEGDRAALICDCTLRRRSSGRVMRYKVAAFQRYRAGKLVEYHYFADSLDILQQSLGRDLELPSAYAPDAVPGPGLGS